MPRILPLLFSCSFMFVLADLPAARAQEQTGPGAKSDREDFKTQWSQLTQQLGTLRGRIEDDTKELSTLTDPTTTQKRVADLQAEISEALAETDDNGPVATLAQKVLETQKAWLAQARAHGFAPDRMAFLEEKYETNIKNAEQAVESITAIRHELAESLKKLGGEQDYLDELARIDEGQEMVKVLQNLLQEMHNTSNTLKALVSSVPGV